MTETPILHEIFGASFFQESPIFILKGRNGMSVFSGVLFVIDEYVVKSLSASLPD